MSQLVDVLYPVPDLRRTPLSTLKWWESRRLVYNKAVGAAGLVTLATVSVFIFPFFEGEPFLQPVLAFSAMYALLANLCYTMGPMAELAARALWGKNAPDVGPLLFRQGLIFSVGLTLLPILVVALFWVLDAALSIVS